MAKVRKTDVFLGKLQDAMRPLLPGDWVAEGAPDWRLLLRHEWGYVGVGPLMSFKGLPATNVYLTYGVKHNQLEPVLKRLDEAAGHEHFETYQVHQTTINYPLVGDCRWVSVEDYNVGDFAEVARQLLGGGAVERLLSIFDRFADLKEIRRSLEDGDGALLTLGAADKMVAIDLALDDLGHLRRFRDNCRPRYFTTMIDNALETLGITI